MHGWNNVIKTNNFTPEICWHLQHIELSEEWATRFSKLQIHGICKVAIYCSPTRCSQVKLPKKTLQSHTVILFSYFFSKCENTPSSFLRGMGERSVGSSVPKKFAISQMYSTNKYKENQAQVSIFQDCQSIMKLSVTFPGLIPLLVPGQQAVLLLH